MTAAMAHNLGRIMRTLIGAGKPRYAAVLAERLCFIYLTMKAMLKSARNFCAARRSNETENLPKRIATFS